MAIGPWRNNIMISPQCSNRRLQPMHQPILPEINAMHFQVPGKFDAKLFQPVDQAHAERMDVHGEAHGIETTDNLAGFAGVSECRMLPSHLRSPQEPLQSSNSALQAYRRLVGRRFGIDAKDVL